MTAHASSARVLLVPETRSAATGGPYASKVRRYRLARMRLLERRDASAARHPQLTRAYD